jgi:hypothetical protein
MVGPEISAKSMSSLMSESGVLNSHTAECMNCVPALLTWGSGGRQMAS